MVVQCKFVTLLFVIGTRHGRLIPALLQHLFPPKCPLSLCPHTCTMVGMERQKGTDNVQGTPDFHHTSPNAIANQRTDRSFPQEEGWLLSKTTAPRSWRRILRWNKRCFRLPAANNKVTSFIAWVSVAISRDFVTTFTALFLRCCDLRSTNRIAQTQG
mmetsp:Transcript_16420/g.19711  ORF Transcript_16420/g.19711 Transcript_16420/m.19711 type:complete len:158 (-) Transcript_16420:9-482(-)